MSTWNAGTYNASAAAPALPGTIAYGEKPQGRKGSVLNRYTRVFLALTTDRHLSSKTVINGLATSFYGIAYGDHYAVYDAFGALVEEDLASFVTDLTAQCVADDDGVQWEITVDYNPREGNQGKDPTDWPIKISWGSAAFEKAATHDRDGNPITNSAGESFDPAVPIDSPRPVLRVVRNEPYFDPTVANAYSNTVNKFDWFIPDDNHKWKCMPITADLEFNRDVLTPDHYYYVVTYEFHYNPDRWTEKVLDQGMRVIDDDGNLVPALEKGLPVTDPIPLDGSGQALPGGGDPNYLPFDIYHEKDFDPFGFDFAGTPGQPPSVLP